jgi:hypothetical protein
MEDAPERDPPSSSGLRGWLSEVYWSALVAGQAEPLARRLGDRATVDDPLFGRAHGLPALAGWLEEASIWLRRHAAEFQRTAFTMGVDRDVTEGSLSLTFDGKDVMLPVAVVAERRKEREVELRVYYARRPVGGAHTARAALLEPNDVPLHSATNDYLAALARGDVDGVLATFENGGALRDGVGRVHTREGGELRRFYEHLLAGGGLQVMPAGRADDGRTCTLEYTVARVGATPMAPVAGLVVYERGETGLFREVRVYREVEM